MHPIFITFPTLGAPFSLHMYGVLTALGVFLAIQIITREARRKGLDADQFVNLALGLLLSGVVGSRILYVAIEWPLYIDRPWAVLNIREGGLVFLGGLIGALLYLGIFVARHRLSVWQTADIVAPAVPFGHVFGRLGCLSAGCCYGAPTPMPWAVTFGDPEAAGAPLGIPLHPVQLYESLGNLLVFMALLYVLRRRHRFDGQVALLYLILYPVLRLVTELFRGDLVRGFFLEAQLGQLISTSQAISILVLVLGVSLYAWRSRHHPPGSRAVGEAAHVG